MMKTLVIGGRGLLGSALVKRLIDLGHDTVWTTRHKEDGFFLDLSEPIPDLPYSEVTFIVAAIATYRGAEMTQQGSWLVNADAPVEIAQQVIKKGSFPVFVSTDAVEWLGFTGYGRQKTYADLGVRMLGGAVVRPTKFTAENVPKVCDLLIDIGQTRKPGVYRWV